VLDAVAVARRHDRGLTIAQGHAMALLERLGLADRAMQPCARLAPALRRRVEIARALATSPRLLLLDEPAAGLTTAEQRDLARCLRDLTRDEGLGLLVIEHDIAFLSALADRLVCLVEGSVIAAGTPAAVRADARVRAAYLGAAAEPVENARF
jgi:ABC-type branched-subunit amino acid transport system ATPase component